MRQLIFFCYVASFYLLSTALLVAQHFTFVKPTQKKVRMAVEIKNNLILLPLRINNSYDLHFILDTGVKTTLLTESVMAKFIDLDTSKKVRITGLGVGEIIEASFVEDVTIHLKGITGCGLNLIIPPAGLLSFSELFGKPVHGLIGYDLLKDFVVEINYIHQYIELHQADTYTYKRKKGTKIQLSMNKGQPYIQSYLSNAHGKSVQIPLLIDTGASQALSVFDSSFVRPNNTLSTYLGEGLAGKIYGELGRLDHVIVGEFDIQSVVTGFPAPESFKYLLERRIWRGNIGGGILRRFHVVLDYKRKHLYLKKNMLYHKKFTYNRSGIEVEALGTQYNSFLISYINPSTKSQADIQIHDQILSINGKSTSDMNIDEVYAELNKKRGSNICLLLRRRGRYIKRCFTIKTVI